MRFVITTLLASTALVACSSSSGPSKPVEEIIEAKELLSAKGIEVNADGTLKFVAPNGQILNIDPDDLPANVETIEHNGITYTGVANDEYTAVAGLGDSSIASTARAPASSTGDGLFSFLSGNLTPEDQLSTLAPVVYYDGQMQLNGSGSFENGSIDSEGNRTARPEDSGTYSANATIDLTYTVDFNQANVSGQATNLESNSIVSYRDGSTETGTYNTDYETSVSGGYISRDSESNIIDQETFDGEYTDSLSRDYNFGSLNGNKFELADGDVFDQDFNSDDYDSYSENFDVQGGFFGENGQFIAGTITGTIESEESDTNGNYSSSDEQIYGVFEGEKR